MSAGAVLKEFYDNFGIHTGLELKKVLVNNKAGVMLVVVGSGTEDKLLNKLQDFLTKRLAPDTVLVRRQKPLSYEELQQELSLHFGELAAIAEALTPKLGMCLDGAVAVPENGGFRVDTDCAMKLDVAENLNCWRLLTSLCEVLYCTAAPFKAGTLTAGKPVREEKPVLRGSLLSKLEATAQAAAQQTDRSDDYVPMAEAMPVPPTAENDIPLPEPPPDLPFVPDNVPETPQVDAVLAASEEYKRERLEQLRQEVVEGNKAAEKKRRKQGNAPANATDEGKPFRKRSVPKDEACIYGRAIEGDRAVMKEITEGGGKLFVEGELVSFEVKELKNGSLILTMLVSDHTETVSCKQFVKPEEWETLSAELKKGKWYQVSGVYAFDTYQKAPVLRFYAIKPVKHEGRRDTSEEKRIELHAHTTMSAFDSVADAAKLVKTAIGWGHPAIAITDHGVLQAFPNAFSAAWRKKEPEPDIKVIYGMEGYLVDDSEILPVKNAAAEDFDTDIVAIDVETTGLLRTDKITELSAVRISGGEVKEVFTELIDPEIPIPSNITELTGIDDSMVAGKRKIEEVMGELYEFCKGAVLCAHNARFDMGLLERDGNSVGLSFRGFCLVDTLQLSRGLFPNEKNHKLDAMCKRLGVRLDKHHRAFDDAAACGLSLHTMYKRLKAMGCEKLADINQHMGFSELLRGLKPRHIILLAKNLTGIKHLNMLVTDSNLKYFYRVPRIPKSLLMGELREGLILGSACEAGELFQAVMENEAEDRIRELAEFYDYLEVQPIGNNEFYVREGTVKDDEALRDLNRRIIELGERYNRPVVATGDVHFIEKEDSLYRAIIMNSKGFEDAAEQAPLYMRTTQEMLDEFAYLSPEKAHEIVIENPKKIADMVENLRPVPEGTFTPVIDNAEQDIENVTISRAKELYGDPLPEIVQKQIDKELKSIIGNGYAVLYLIAMRLVKHSNEEGYLVGSRGSVGSSLVAFLTGITEVNSLPPHYLCPNCRYSDFNVDAVKYQVGKDLPPAVCPVCGAPLNREGYDIKFEVFLGFKGDKVPDIDLNFSGEYQSRAHKYTEVLLGTGNVFRAGTIMAVQEKTAYGYVRKYADKYEMPWSEAEMSRLALCCTGVKTTSSQHPGGLIVVPRNVDIYDFTALQHPAEDTSSDTVTTHFDYHFLHDSLTKLDLLGHDDPTVLKLLKDLTGIEPKEIDVKDEKVLSLFSGTEVLGVTPEAIGSQTATYGVPEFGTPFVRRMLEKTKPHTISELLRISGLSHGTDVWNNNAEVLIDEGTCTLAEVISTRDDIMIYLMQKGLEPATAFKIMETVRKGKKSGGLTEEQAEEMRRHGVPEWYIEACYKIQYLFPKAHAAAYVIMALRVAWFKVYRPKEYYAVYFTVRADVFDVKPAMKSPEELRRYIRELKGNSPGEETPEETPDASDEGGDEKGGSAVKNNSLATVLELVLEMKCRGFVMHTIDLNLSYGVNFRVTEDGIICPFNSLPGIGAAAALQLETARNEKPFSSVEDLRNRGKLSRTAIGQLRGLGILKGLPESDQLSFFDLMG